MAGVLVLCLGTVMLWNFFDPTTKDVSHRGSNNLLNANYSKNIAGLLAASDSCRFSSTSTIPHHGSTQESNGGGTGPDA